MSKDDLRGLLAGIPKGEIVPGMTKGKIFRFVGLEKYSGRGRYSYLTGKEVVVLESERKKGPIKLFLEPLLNFVHVDKSALRYGNIPLDCILPFINERLELMIPNLSELMSHYHVMALFVQQREIDIKGGAAGNFD